MTTASHTIAFYADLCYDSPLSPPSWIPPANLEVEAILLGGDIHYAPDRLHAMLRDIRASQPASTQLVVVPGNGEYIGQELTQSRREYRAAVTAVPNAVFLDDGVTVLPSGLRIIGSTLWSLVTEEEIGAYTGMLAAHGLRGVDDIRLGGRFLTLHDTNDLYRQSRSFLAAQLGGLSAAERSHTVVCTHFWPTLRPWLNQAGQPEAQWYQLTGSDLDDLIAERGPRLWLCGHAHTSHEVTIGGTRILSNPRAGDGPGNINPGFQELCVIEL